MTRYNSMEVEVIKLGLRDIEDLGLSSFHQLILPHYTPYSLNETSKNLITFPRFVEILLRFSPSILVIRCMCGGGIGNINSVLK